MGNFNFWRGIQKHKTRSYRGWEARASAMEFVKPAPPKSERSITRQQAKDSTRSKRAKAQSLADRLSAAYSDAKANDDGRRVAREDLDRAVQ